MNNKETNELNEELQNEICRCGDDKCGYFPLKHFQKCPKCKSTGFHLKIKIGDKKESDKKDIKED